MTSAKCYCWSLVTVMEDALALAGYHEAGETTFDFVGAWEEAIG